MKCPKCGADVLGEKRNKAGELSLVCLNKECDYREEVKEEEKKEEEEKRREV